jgi:ceroid-lipofuscinosis MFS transporter 7
MFSLGEWSDLDDVFNSSSYIHSLCTCYNPLHATGLGAGAGATLYGELARISTKEERTKVFAIFSTFRQIGLIFGPAFNLVLRLLHVDMGPFILDRLTAPGALMTVIWVVIEIMFLFMFYQLPSAIEPMVVENSSVNGDLNRNTSARQTSSGDGKAGLLVTLGPKPTDKKNILAKSAVGLSSNAGESSPLLRDPQKTPNYSVNRGGAVAGAGREGRAKRPKGRAYVKYVVSQMVQEEIVVLLFVLFITIYTQMVLETMLVPIAESILDWTETEISIFYSCAGIELIVGIFTVYLISIWLGDRWIMLSGLFLSLVSFVWLLGFTGSGSKVSGAVWKFVLGCIPLIFGLPLNLVAGASLYSKLLPMPVQGIGQGFRRSMFSVAAILGPLWAGSALAFQTYYVLLGVPVALLAFVMVLVILSFVRLKEPSTRRRNLFFP